MIVLIIFDLEMPDQEVGEALEPEPELAPPVFAAPAPKSCKAEPVIPDVVSLLFKPAGCTKTIPPIVGILLVIPESILLATIGPAIRAMNTTKITK
jgi:hypothetical protein